MKQTLWKKGEDGGLVRICEPVRHYLGYSHVSQDLHPNPMRQIDLLVPPYVLADGVTLNEGRKQDKRRMYLLKKKRKAVIRAARRLSTSTDS